MSSQPSGVVIPFDTERQRKLPVHECAGCMRLEAEKEALAAQTEQMAVDLLGQERELKAYRRKVSRLEQEIERIVRGPDAPDHKKAQTIFEFWRDSNGKTKRTLFDVKREKSILHALALLEVTWGEDLAPRVLCCAILGNAKLHHTDPRTGVKYNSIETICRDGDMLEKNLGRYFAYCDQAGQKPAIERLEDPS